MSEENKNPLIEAVLKLHEKMVGFGGTKNNDPYQGRNQQRFTAPSTTPDALRVKPSAPSTQAAPKKSAPAPEPKPKTSAPAPAAAAPIPTPKPEQPDKTITPTGNPNMLGIGAKPYNPLSSISTPKVSKSPAIDSANAGIGSKDIDTYDTNTQRDRDYTGDTDSFATTRSIKPEEIKLPSTDSKQRGPMPISGERGSAMSHNFSTDLVDMLADKSTKMQYNTDAITGKKQTFMQRLTDRKVGKKNPDSPELEKTLKSIKIGENETMTNKLIDSFLQLQAMKTDNIFEAAKKIKKLDPVGKEDDDIDNDGDKDKSDGYLHNRRKKIAAAMEAVDPNAEGIAKDKQKAPIMVPKPDYPTSKPGPTRELKGSLPKGVTVKGNTNEEVEQIDEALSADHKSAIKAHVKGMWGRGEVAFGSQGGKDFVSHSDGIQKHVHSIHYKKGVPHVTHFLSMDEEVEQLDELKPSTLRSYRDSANWDVRGIRSGDESNDDFDRDAMMKRRRKGAVLSAKKLRGTAKVNAKEEVEFSEAELEHIAAILEGPVAPTPSGYEVKAFGSSTSRSGTLTDEAIAEEEAKRGRGRPMGSKSGSKYGSGGGNAAGVTHLVDQIKHAGTRGIADGKGNYMLKHEHGTNKDGSPKVLTAAVPQKSANDFYKAYHNTEKPAGKQEIHDKFVAKHFDVAKPQARGISLASMPRPKS